jgi:membrane protein DedA with SNARE-associated domain
MNEILRFLELHGYAVVFFAVLIEQLGLPIPAAPVLLAVGALAGGGRFSAGPGMLLAILACILADGVWYMLGRRRGQAVLSLLCRISLEPDSCVSDTKSWFKRLGASALLAAKFVPGLSTAAPPLAGMTSMSAWKFIVYDAGGSALWAGAFIGLGYAFTQQIEYAGSLAERFGSGFGGIVVVLLAGYVGFKFWQRQRFIKKLRTSRITADELLEKINAGEEVTIIDLRHPLELQNGAMRIKGAVWYERKKLAEQHPEIPRDRDVILYCS